MYGYPYAQTHLRRRASQHCTRPARRCCALAMNMVVCIPGRFPARSRRHRRQIAVCTQRAGGSLSCLRRVARASLAAAHFALHAPPCSQPDKCGCVLSASSCSVAACRCRVAKRFGTYTIGRSTATSTAFEAQRCLRHTTVCTTELCACAVKLWYLGARHVRWRRSTAGGIMCL